MGEAPTIDLTGQVALVTGGTKGLGRSIAQALAGAGAKVVVCARNAPDAAMPDAEFEPADVRDPDAVNALMEAIVARHGRIDVVVNNAGGSPAVAAADYGKSGRGGDVWFADI